MKDYRLSEIKEICEKQKDCDDCECVEFCGIIDAYNGMPIDIFDSLKIEPRDMIELPCKMQYHDSVFGLAWIVLWYNKNGDIDGKNFITEAEADEFIRGLKNEV